MRFSGLAVDGSRIFKRVTGVPPAPRGWDGACSPRQHRSQPRRAQNYSTNPSCPLQPPQAAALPCNGV